MLALFFIFGLIIGSFLNVLVYRLRDAETLLGRSFCRQCRHQIRWYDNLPLMSFVLLYGQCRDCGTRISWQYPAVELVTGLLFALVGYFFFAPDGPALLSGNLFAWLETLWLLLIISLFIVIAAYDLRHMEIPLILIEGSALVTGLFLLASFFFVPEPFLTSRLWLGILGACGVGGFFFALVSLSRETWMGWGDVWLGAVAGAIVGLPLVLPMLTLSFGMGAASGVLALAFQKKGMKSQVPFAPFLVGGTLATFFLFQAFPEYFRFFIF